MTRPLARSILDVDALSKDGRVSGDSLGVVETTVAALVNARGGAFTAPLVGAGAGRGSTLTVTPEELSSSKGTAVLTFQATKLANRYGTRC